MIALAETTGSNAEILDQLDRGFADNAEARKGVAQAARDGRGFRTAGVPEGRLQVDLSICRGLDYYTGTVYETFLLDKPEIGSVCSGGRYDNLAGSLHQAGAARRRRVARPRPADRRDGGAGPAAEDGDGRPGAGAAVRRRAGYGDYQRMARTLRAAGIGTEVYPEAKKLGQQFQYAERRGFRLALIAGSNEFAARRMEDQGPGQEGRNNRHPRRT